MVVGLVLFGILGQRFGLIDLIGKGKSRSAGNGAGLMGIGDEIFAPARHEAAIELDRQTIADSALREGWFFTDRHGHELARTDRELREDLPDADYDQYLYALGKPNRVVAGEVLPGSAASAAGLRRGDIILNYGDARVFKPGEVILASSQGDFGGSVRLIYLRDGQKRTANVELGPFGAILEHSKGEPFTD